MALTVRKFRLETWREAVARIAGEHGVARECLDWFDAEREAGMPEEEAAWNTLYEWDLLNLDGEDTPTSPPR